MNLHHKAPPELSTSLLEPHDWRRLEPCSPASASDTGLWKRSWFKGLFAKKSGTFRAIKLYLWLNKSHIYLNNQPPAWHTSPGRLVWRSGSRNLQAIVWWWARAPLVVLHYQPQLSPKPPHNHNAWLCLYALCHTPVEHRALLHDCNLHHEMFLRNEREQSLKDSNCVYSSDNKVI